MRNNLITHRQLSSYRMHQYWCVLLDTQKVRLLDLVSQLNCSVLQGLPAFKQQLTRVLTPLLYPCYYYFVNTFLSDRLMALHTSCKLHLSIYLSITIITEVAKLTYWSKLANCTSYKCTILYTFCTLFSTFLHILFGFCSVFLHISTPVPPLFHPCFLYVIQYSLFLFPLLQLQSVSIWCISYSYDYISLYILIKEPGISRPDLTDYNTYRPSGVKYRRTYHSIIRIA